MSMLVRIYTFADKRPDFIRWHHATFSRYLADSHELLVVNNAQCARDEQRISRICAELGVTCLWPVEKHHENPNVACSYPIDWVVDCHVSSDRDAAVSVIIDSDMFLLRPFSFIEYLGDHWIAGVDQQREHVHYLWNALVMINHRTMADIGELTFACSGSRASPYYPENLYDGRPVEGCGDTIEGQHVDVGGPTYFYLKNHPECTVRYINNVVISGRAGNLDRLPESLRGRVLRKRYWDILDFELLLDGTFFHYRSGSDWNLRGEVFHAAKTVLAEALFRSVEDEHRSDERVRADASVTLPRASLSMRLRYLWQAVLAGTVDRWFT